MAFSNALHRLIKNKMFSFFASSLGDLTFIGKGVGYFCLTMDSWVCLLEKKQHGFESMTVVIQSEKGYQKKRVSGTG